MRVAIVQQHVDTRRGGAETSTVEMARQLSQLDLEVAVVHAANTDEVTAEDSLRYSPVRVTSRSRARRTHAFITGVHKLCRRERFDIVHAVTPCLSANVYQPRGGTYIETIARNMALTRSPVVRAVKQLGRRFNVSQRFLMRIERRLLTHYRDRVHVAAVSDYVRRQVVTGMNFPADRVSVVFNGVDSKPPPPDSRSAIRSELRVSASTPLVLFVAHNFKLKGLRELIMSTAGHGADWTLAVVGSDRHQGHYVRLAQRLGIADRVRFMGPQSTLPAWYAAVDVLAHPTWYDPCSRVVLEAISLGLPAVTTRYNGAAEIIVPGRNGVVTQRPGDAAELTAAIQVALQPVLRQACQNDAPRMAEQLSMARHARQLKQLYESIISPAQ